MTERDEVLRRASASLAGLLTDFTRAAFEGNQVLRLADVVNDMAEALRRADALGPVATSQRGTRTYRPGIGPHGENAAVRLALDQLDHMPRYAGMKLGQFLPYPDAARQKCDLWIGEPIEWAIEIKWRDSSATTAEWTTPR
jgi:hypothetical protein